MFEALSGQCMSSDEECEPQRFKQTRVLRKDWRDTTLIGVLKWLDYYAELCSLSATGVKQGSSCHPRLRSADGPSSNGPAIAGLPSNFYNAAWIATRNSSQRRALNLQAPIELPAYVLTWPTNSAFRKDGGDLDEYWHPHK